MLDWKKRCRKDQTMSADRKIWETRCGKYRLIFSHIRYGEGILPDVWYALELDNGYWEIISKHRKKNTAQKACEKKHKQKEKYAAAELERLEKRRKRSKKATRSNSRRANATGHTKRGKRKRPSKD